MRIKFAETSRIGDGYIATFSPLEYTLTESDTFKKDINPFSYTDSDIQDAIIIPLYQIIDNTDETDIAILFSEVSKEPDGSECAVEKARLRIVASEHGCGMDLETDPTIDNSLVDALRHIASDVSMYSYEIVDRVTSKTSTPVTASVKKVSSSSTADSVDSDLSKDEIDKLIAEIQQRTKADVVKPKETLADYVCDSTLREELEEIRNFMEKEAEYKSKGVSIPKGILFKGVPGTGKTYAARCVAGTTDCYFLVCTASSLQGQYIGSGAENVRNLFKGAKVLHKMSKKGVIVFIDELDSFGSRDKRGGSSSGEEDRTLNQLLAELSGFEDSEGVMVMGATNYPDRIDDALMRAGRFSRQITIRKPEMAERLSLVEYYFKKISMPIVGKSYAEIANLMQGLTPADIKEIANESAILSIRHSLSNITIDNINEAVNKVITKNIRTPDGKLDTHLVAAHEAGHVVAEHMYNGNIAIKVTNYSYGGAGGFTQPSEYLEGLFTEKRMLNEVKVLLAGRAAERVVYGYETNGASNDLERAEAILRSYYTKYYFEPYDVSKLDQIIQDKLHDLCNAVYTDFTEPELFRQLTEITNQLDRHRVLYTEDLAPILITKGHII